MITSFFKPKSGKKVTPEPSDTTDASSDSRSKKRTLEDGASNSTSRDKRSKTNDDAAVRELISYLNPPKGQQDTVLKPEIAWTEALDKHFASPSFARLANFVAAQRKSHVIYPPASDTFSALNWTPLENVKVVIVGQDPYHGPDQAHGLCFSVRKGVRTPPSLRNIYKELKDDPLIPNFNTLPSHGNLERWAKQGVLMINTVLTVRQGEPNSHKNKGWELVTDEILRAVDRRAKEKCDKETTTTATTTTQSRGIVYLLWGKPAADKCQTALGVSNLSLAKSTGSSGQSSHRKIICTSHPSPLGATKTDAPFLGSQCFSKANQALLDFGYEQGIDWRVDGDI